jgi:hypothetical protein
VLILFIILGSVIIFINILAGNGFKVFSSLHKSFTQVKRHFLDYSFFVNIFNTFFFVNFFFSILQYSKIENQSVVQASAALSIIINLLSLLATYYLLILTLKNYEDIQYLNLKDFPPSNTMYPFRSFWLTLNL